MPDQVGILGLQVLLHPQAELAQGFRGRVGLQDAELIGEQVTPQAIGY